MRKFAPMEKEVVRVIWFNKNKGFGEGKNEAGKTVFLHYKALKEAGSLEPGQKVMCSLFTEDKRLIAFSIEKHIIP